MKNAFIAALAVIALTQVSAYAADTFQGNAAPQTKPAQNAAQPATVKPGNMPKESKSVSQTPKAHGKKKKDHSKGAQLQKSEQTKSAKG